ncbi:MAG: AbrB/MazE/SpoVT family DNA-binding domain-containing protein [Acidobacteriota bacterium]
MSKVTRKLQVTIPKAIADAYGIAPGSELTWEPAGAVIRIVPGNAGLKALRLGLEERLALFDEATKRQGRRNKRWRKLGVKAPSDRGWSREELYGRGGAR